MNSDRFYRVVILVLIAIVVWLAFRIEGLRGQLKESSEAFRREIIKSDSMVKEAEGRYAKLVDYFSSQKDLDRELKETNRELYKMIKSQDEKILSLTKSVISLASKQSSGSGAFDPNDSSMINLALRYPDEKDPFVKWDGSVDSKSAAYKGTWSFNHMPINVVLTEDSRGLWKHRVIGPDWLIIDSLMVNSLPPEKYAQQVEKKLQFMLGGGYISSLDRAVPPDLSIGGGVSIDGNHNLILNATTDKRLGFNYYYQFKSMKKRN